MCHSEIIHYLPFDYVVSSWSMENDFFRFLRERCHVSVAELECLLCRYLIGSTRDGGIIYWQLDFNGNVRTGKVMYYDANSGHRIKTGMAVDWIQLCIMTQIAVIESRQAWQLIGYIPD